MLPVVLDLRGIRVLVVGGGRIAYRKAKSLHDEGAHVTVISPNFVADFETLENAVLTKREFVRGDAAGFQLIITATGNTSVDQVVYEEATDRNLWVNSADDPDRCTFYLSANHRQGNVVVAVSTEGKSPALASHLRDVIAKCLPANIAAAANELANQRTALKMEGVSTESIDWESRIAQALSDTR